MVNQPGRPFCPGGTVYTIRAGDSLYNVAQRFNTTITAIIRANPGLSPDDFRVGRRICIPVEYRECSGFLYTIRAGDSIYTIARRYGVWVQDLVDANPDIDPDDLFIGQEICIPGISRPPRRLYRPPTLPRRLPARPFPPRRPRRSAMESDDSFDQPENFSEDSEEILKSQETQFEVGEEEQ